MHTCVTPNSLLLGWGTHNCSSTAGLEKDRCLETCVEKKIAQACKCLNSNIHECPALVFPITADLTTLFGGASRRTELLDPDHVSSEILGCMWRNLEIEVEKDLEECLKNEW